MGQKPPRLLADCMLGRLARWLRLMGYDTAYDNSATDLELARRSRSEGRILLTGDRELAGRRGLRTILVGSQVLEDQVREVYAALPLRGTRREARCALCNEALEAVTRDDASHLVPPFILRTHDEFQRCPGCGRVYWPGSHFEAIKAQIREFLAEDTRGE